MVSMKQLTTSQRAQVIRCLVEGNSIRSTVRITGIAKNTIVKLLGEIGCACAAYHNKAVRNVRVRRLQCDEIWEFVGAKAKNVTPEKKAAGWGDIWTWTGHRCGYQTNRLVPCRRSRAADGLKDFMEDCAKRIRNRVQITTDGHKVYLEAVENAFGADIDYAQLQKIYGAPSDEGRGAIPRRSALAAI